MFTEEVATNLDNMLNALCDYIDAVSEDDEARDFIAMSCASKFVIYALSERGSDIAEFDVDEVMDKVSSIGALCLGDYDGE